MCFPIFPCITNRTLHNIHVTPKMVKMVIIVLYLAIWKSCESELLYMRWSFLYMFERIILPDCWEVLSVFCVFKSVWENYMAKSYHPIIPVSVVSKILQEHASNKLKAYLPLKIIVCNDLTIKMQLLIFFIWRKKYVPLSRYLDLCFSQISKFVTS